MAKSSRKVTGKAGSTPASTQATSAKAVPAEAIVKALAGSAPAGRPSSLIDTRVIYCGDMLAKDCFPVQVKQSDKVSRPDVDAFEAVMEREGPNGRQRGFFVAFGYSEDAKRECAAFHKRTGRLIKLLTVQEILDEEHVQTM
jgi:hypothetical protein